MLIPLVINAMFVLTMLGQAFLVALLAGWLFAFVYAPWRQTFHRLLAAVFHRRDISFAFLVALGAVAGSLFMSEVAGFAPCVLCWYQRAAVYPAALILGVDVARMKTRVRPYAMALSIAGFVVAGYQNLLQAGLLPPPACTLSPDAVSCTQTYTLGFGYITIPLMSLTAFALLIAILAIGAWLEKTYASNQQA